ncbi:DNA-binding MarR family transcriptional regulator [Lipingzhangella halophila]|uniref:DNA-binding MarR family transcriptional regulator n=1 Tax=Lipingzhangella halophila TaxID=1783352 RepID=A0A7W7W290_9ACTN|nr:MarR family transcriptional regulator [Lipingzhangella halophila]MBB4931767.1 DNA-binding MarR family transcriptional regulator [Lipingzhangella halophila]
MASGYPPSMLSRVSFVLGKLHLRCLERESGELGALGIDVKQHAVLSVLADEGPMTQQELGQRLGIDRTTIVTVVDGLDRAGLLERRRSPTDRRAHLLTLTPAGRHTQQQGQHRVADAERALLGTLDETERRTLIDLLSRALDGR